MTQGGVMVGVCDTGRGDGRMSETGRGDGGGV